MVSSEVQFLKQRELKNQTISDSVFTIDNDLNLHSKSEAFSKVVFEVVAPNAVTVQAQKNFTSFRNIDSLNENELQFLKDIIGAKDD